MIYHKYKCIFIHGKKTGGTSIQRWFEANGCPQLKVQDHTPVRESMEMYADYWDLYTKFAVVRNPWAYAHSLWHNLYINRAEKIYNYTELGLYGFLKKRPPISQYNFLMMHRGCKLDFIGRFEQLNEVFEFVKNKFGLNHDPPHELFVNNKPHYTEVYNQESIDRIARIYRRDIKTWNYEYGQ